MEIEAKFSIPDEVTFQRLLAMTTLAGFRLGELSVADLHDSYLDTVAGAMQAGGYACRIRREGDRTLATLKGLGGAFGPVHRRVELEVELAAPLPQADWPASAARDLALRICGSEPLTPLFEIEQTRHSRPLYDGERIVAHVNLDRVRVHRDDPVTATFLEFEAELAPQGSEEDLERIVQTLQEMEGLEPDGRSKFERGFRAGRIELLDKPGIEADDPMSEAGRKTFRFHFRRMLYHEPGTRLGEDIEALHDMRVATRRMRAAFRVFGEFYVPKAVAPHIKGLKRTGRALGAVRDLDVFREKVHEYLAEPPDSKQEGLAPFLGVLEERREAARQRMIAYLDSKKYRRFVERFGEFVETEGLGRRPIALNGGEPHPYRVRHVAPVAIYGRMAAVRAYGEWVTIPDVPLERLHALRIACKRLRYTLEYFKEVLGPDTKALIQEIVTVQDHLGALQDTVVASEILRQFLTWGAWGHEPDAEPPPQPPGDPGVEAYLAATEAELQNLVSTFPQIWARITEAEFSQLVAEAVMVL